MRNGNLMTDFEAYTHNGDGKLLATLGLRTSGSGPAWVDLGTVEVAPASASNPYDCLTGPCPASTVKVEVCAMPSMFWRFTITRSRDEVVDDESAPRGWRAVYEPCQVYEMRTGTGSFGEFWPTAEMLAQHWFSISRLDKHDPSP